MGCDIHCFPEVRNDAGVWEPLYGNLQTCTECNGSLIDPYQSLCVNCERPAEDHDEVSGLCFGALSKKDVEEVPCNSCTDRWAPPGKWEHWDARFYSGRNYALFAVLAGVRGAPQAQFTQAGRGIPYTSCGPIHNEFASWGDDAHSETYYTLAELLEYDWAQNGLRDFARSVAALKVRTSDKSPDDVRVVMWFDN